MAPRAILSRRVKELALAQGFERVGITRAEPLAGAALLEEWLSKGYAGGMSYMARNRDCRRDPRRYWPEAVSIVCVALNYNAPAPGEKVMEDGRVAMYARGRDYHLVLREKLTNILAGLKELEPPIGGKVCVDTSPLMERELSARAGIGWIGKNTNVLSKDLGSWLFIGELLLNVELDYDGPVEEGCATCTLCLEACPTGALVGPYQLDSRRCISYLTIELRGAIPEEMRPAIDDWLFGCDICQEVCPYNAKAPETREPSFAPREDLSPASLTRLFTAQRTDIERRLKESALSRAKASGLLRNLSVVMGNSRHPETIPHLAMALEDPDPVVRGHSAWALGMVGGGPARGLLERRRSQETDPEVMSEIETALKGLASGPR